MINNAQDYPAPWSFIVWVKTIIIGVLVFCVIPYFTINYYSQSIEYSRMHNIYPIVISMSVSLIFALAIFFAPQKYIVTDSQVIVKRLGPNVRIPTKDIADIQYLSKSDLKHVIRIFGVGGFGGMYGIYYNSNIGVLRMYATNMNDLVLIKCRDQSKYLLSPKKPKDFLDAVKSTLA